MTTEPSAHTFVHFNGDWLLFDDPRAALDHLFPGASNRAELMIAVAQSAQHAELEHWERVRRRHGTASMTVEELAIYTAPKGERFERDLPERWVGKPALYLTVMQLHGAPLPLGSAERVRPRVGQMLLMLERAGILDVM
ncbi:hypothetical protein KK092_07110 [Curtobacterium flaccumfaciens pv. flaccumfaciens]|uniref:hypothetical protein n=1 Tax=Curtobacterium flaccumfaciens TaxID=2035 RepID=UPI001BDF5B44|nr:hypothetical protein [Curtobacterium flaccumfaciens]MBT1669146.1 hypothetical protein [Curtobacterium flaccumfaciens pv. flaccumfaciens]